MSVAVQIAVANANTSAQSSARESARKKQECIDYILPNFDNTTATIQQKQQYADCVDRVYPDTFSGGEVLFFKILIVAMLIGIFGGLWKALKGFLCHHRKWEYVEWDEVICYPILGGIGLPILVAAVIGVVYSTVWLFKG